MLFFIVAVIIVIVQVVDARVFFQDYADFSCARLMNTAIFPLGVCISDPLGTKGSARIVWENSLLYIYVFATYSAPCSGQPTGTLMLMNNQCKGYGNSPNVSYSIKYTLLDNNRKRIPQKVPSSLVDNWSSNHTKIFNLLVTNLYRNT